MAHIGTLTVTAVTHAPIEKVWELWTLPEHIVNWAFASDDWEAPHAENDVRVGGRFRTVMAAKDESASFDFAGVYTAVRMHRLLEYTMGDGRKVKAEFVELPGAVKITETFEAEEVNPVEMQRSGWQAILDNFAKYAEANKSS
jgi:uncharacterized protein YndB with AHSA1/START domain